ncbi:transglutaminase domain-containing protein [Treponema sp.]|uniref:transglutaminase domain-containing protein n=1 Tax=Treponema sp. TaxID=166 RepID=UPI0025EFDD8B|nr:transglutaminase domain-containing protein [Treponema sp.]MCR5219042.1 IPT/TIG domain-containing protein [Treponema sp.]
MNLLNPFITLLRRSPAVRFACFFGLIALIIFGSAFIGKQTQKKPVIHKINPVLGLPGNTMTIYGENFGEVKGSSYVEISGSKINNLDFSLWSDKKIQFTIPQNVSDGLVIVANSSGKSEPAFFANENRIPVAVRPDPQTTIPVVSTITKSANIGDIITITGKNFGAARGNSKVYFTANREDISGEKNTSEDIESNYICASENDYDYILWTDGEISVKVPDGAASGPVFVATSRGISDSVRTAVNFPAGKKSYVNKHTFVIQITADISTASASQEAFITLYMPRPAECSFQPSINLNEYYPDPLIKDDPRDVIYQKSINSITNHKQRFSQTYVITSYEVKSNILSSKIAAYKDTKSVLYTAYTSPDACVPSNHETVIELKNLIVGKEKNPYKKARLIYDYLLENYKLENKVRPGEASVLDLPRRNSGDAYDFAILFTALCRAADIPSIPCSGILASSNSLSQAHWWSEIYFENYGWFPVDIALASGMDFTAFVPAENPREYYFGNIDCQHIYFSRGWNQIRASLINSKTVYLPRSYALQSIWEEASDETSSYSSLWNTPSINGIY